MKNMVRGKGTLYIIHKDSVSGPYLVTYDNDQQAFIARLEEGDDNE